MAWSAPWVTVEVGYGSTWQTEPGDITWTDETAKVLVRNRVQCTRGASAARGKVDTGTAKFSLLNTDRRFDPTHTTGDLFGQLLPGTPVRLLAWPVDQLLMVAGQIVLVDGLPVTTGSSIELWSGTVPSWPQRYDKSNRHAWCPINAFDRFDKLSRAKIPRSVLEAEILADSPTAYWPLNETSGQVMVDASGSGYDGTYMTGTTALAGTIGDFATPALILDGENHYGTVAQAAPVNLTIEAVIDLDRAENLVDGEKLVIYEGGNGDTRGSGLGFSHQWGVEIVSAAGGTARLFHRGSGLFTGNGYSTTFSFHGVHHVAIQVSASLLVGDVRDHYIDGVESNGSSSPSAATGVFNGVSIGRSKANGSQWRGGLASVVLLPVGLDPARIAAHATAALEPREGERSDERVDWLLDEIDWPANLRDLSTGRSLLGSATFKPGDGALEYFRLVEATEDGRLFIGPDGSVTFHDRFWRYLESVATVSQFTFTDQDGDQGYAEFQLDLDDELLVNVARFSRRDGAEQVATDSASIAAYGEAEEQRTDLLSTTDAQVRSLAEWAVATKSTPLPRVPSIRIPLHRYSAADQATVLGLDLGHRVTVNRTPQGVGAEIDLDFLVEGVSHDIGFNEWWVNLFVSPVPEDSAELFILGTSELGGTHILAH